MQYTIDGLDSQVHDVLFDNIPTQLKIYSQFVLNPNLTPNLNPNLNLNNSPG